LTTTIDFCNGCAELTGEEYFVMVRETWEMWADEYQEYYEAEDYEGLDDLEAWKEEEQKVIDELIQRMQGAYNDV
jgi:hypothetical protein